MPLSSCSAQSFAFVRDSWIVYLSLFLLGLFSLHSKCITLTARTHARKGLSYGLKCFILSSWAFPFTTISLDFYASGIYWILWVFILNFQILHCDWCIYCRYSVSADKLLLSLTVNLTSLAVRNLSGTEREGCHVLANTLESLLWKWKSYCPKYSETKKEKLYIYYCDFLVSMHKGIRRLLENEALYVYYTVSCT